MSWTRKFPDETKSQLLNLSCCCNYLLTPFLIWYASRERKGFRNLMFPLWFALLGGYFVFWTWGLPFCSLYSLFFYFFEYFGLFMIGRVSSSLRRQSWHLVFLLVIDVSDWFITQNQKPHSWQIDTFLT